MKTQYELKDTCWITVGESAMVRGEVKRGRVVATMNIPNHPTVYYVIELDDTDHLHLEVRDALLMRPEEYSLEPFVGEPIPDNMLYGINSLVYEEGRDAEAYDDFEAPNHA